MATGIGGASGGDWRKTWGAGRIELGFPGYDFGSTERLMGINLNSRLFVIFYNL